MESRAPSVDTAPMIYLIGGPARVGKTILAQRLAAELKIGWLPLRYNSIRTSAGATSCTERQAPIFRD